MVINMKLQELLMKVKNTVYTMNIHEQGSYNLLETSLSVVDNIKANMEQYYNREVVSIYANSYGELEIVIAKE